MAQPMDFEELLSPDVGDGDNPFIGHKACDPPTLATPSDDLPSPGADTSAVDVDLSPPALSSQESDIDVGEEDEVKGQTAEPEVKGQTTEPETAESEHSDKSKTVDKSDPADSVMIVESEEEEELGVGSPQSSPMEKTRSEPVQCIPVGSVDTSPNDKTLSEPKDNDIILVGSTPSDGVTQEGPVGRDNTSDATPVGSGAKPEGTKVSKWGRKRGNHDDISSDREGEGECLQGDTSPTTVLIDDDGDDNLESETDSSEDQPEESLEERLKRQPIDHEVEARELDISEIKDGEIQTNRAGREIKKPNNYSPDHDYTARVREKKTRKRKRKHSHFGSTGVTTGIKLVKRTTVHDPMWKVPFDHGWRREIVLRATFNEGKSRAADVYYYPPVGGKLRSKLDIGRYLEKHCVNTDLTADHFTFLKSQIHEEPMEFVREALEHKFGIGRRKSNTPTSSPSKSPITPVMKQKKSPFVKSPLSLKKSAMGVKSPTSPKHLILGNLLKLSGRTASVDPTSSSHIPGPVIITNSMTGALPKPGSPIISVIKPTNMSASDSTATVGTGHPLILRVSPQVTQIKRAVAKKHTGKRGPTYVTMTNKPKSDGPRLCSLKCPGRVGIPPSLHCGICMCMFHPECVGVSPLQRMDGYYCKECRASDTAGSQSTVAPSSQMAGLRGPPPLKISGAGIGIVPSVVPSTIQSARTGGPPPLRVVSSRAGPPSLRQPPPLRMAPGLTASALSQTTVPTVVHGLGASHTSNVTVVTKTLPAHSVTQTSQGVISSNGVTIQQQVRAKEPPPITVSLPPTTPKEINGQILALPGNITNKMNMQKPIVLKVNGQRYIIPPHCFINTSEGAKIYLPPGYLPNKMTQGPSKPLNVNLNCTPGKDDQLLQISAMEETIDKNGTSGKMTVTSSKESEQILPTSTGGLWTPSGKEGRPQVVCPIQQLHVGFDCMLHIFRYLGIKDLLRAQGVCKTWRRVSSQHCMWKRIQLRGCRISNWEKAAKSFKDNFTQFLDLRGIVHYEDTNRMWHQLTGVLHHLSHLQRLDFGQCPGTVLHAVADKLKGLSELTAEFITDATQDQQHIWSYNTKLDIGKFAELGDLEVLKLRGVCGLSMPAFSFSGGLTELSALTNLRALSLTTLRDIAEDEFSFLGSLVKLEELELGDLSSWKPETYSQLANLIRLRSLRLECGTDYAEEGLGEALEHLKKLTNLELIKFSVSKGLVRSLPKLSSLESLSIWPDTETQAAHVNTLTLKAVSNMSSLKQLDWGIMIDASSSTSPDDDSNSSTDLPSRDRNKQRDCIPILPLDYERLTEDDDEDEQVALLTEYLNINKLVDRLSSYLPDAKIRVFKVPIISAPKASGKRAQEQDEA